MQKNRILALILAISLLTCLFAACGKTEAPAAEAPAEQAAQAPAEEPTEEPAEEPAEAPVEEPAEAPVEESAEAPAEEPVEEPAEEPAEEPVSGVTMPPIVTAESTISYPLDTDIELTTWASIKGSYFAYAEDYNDSEILPFAEEGSGVKLVVTTVTDTIASEQYKLMIASDDWTDFLGFSMYSGGLNQAYNDDVALAITDEEMETYAPDYWTILKSLPENCQGAARTEGMNLALYTIKDKVLVEDGLMLRGDWLDACGLSAPTTLEELENVLYTFQETYQTERTLDFPSGGAMSFVNDCFDTKCVGYSTSVMGSAPDVPIYMNGDTVTCSWIEPGFRDYMEWTAKLYADGIIYCDFYNENPGPTGKYPNITANQVGVWNDPPGKVGDWEDYVTEETDPNLQVLPIVNPTNGDGVYNWNTEQNVISDGWMITTTCQDLELVLNYLNYYYTTEGAMQANYGGEGWTFEYDEAGKPYLTDILVHNEFNMNIGASMGIYTMVNLVPHYAFEERRFTAMDPVEVETYSLVNDTPLASDHFFPAAAKLTTAETDALVSPVNDMCTISEEMLLAMLIGQTPITDETWQDFVDSMYANGLQDALDTYQLAYDEYVAGKR